MEKIELNIEKKKAETLINFLKELDFVEVKKINKKQKSSSKNLDDIFISASNPLADISNLFGAWKDSKIYSSNVRNSSRKTDRLQW